MAGADGAGVVARRGHDFVVLQAAFGIGHVPCAHADVAVHGVEFAAVHADFAGDFARGGRHNLHQALCADAGLCAEHEAAFLADEAVNPCRVDACFGGIAAGNVAEGRDVAQVVVEFVRSAVGGVDGHFVELVVVGKLGGGQFGVFVEAARGVTPFRLCGTAHGAVAAACFEQGEGAGDGAVACQGVEVSAACSGGIVVGADAVAEFFGGQYGVEVASALLCFTIEGLGAGVVPARGVAAAEPVQPGWIALQFGRHGGDDVGQCAPVLKPQGGTGEPFELVVCQLVAVGTAVVFEGGGEVLAFGLTVRQYAPGESGLFAGEEAFLVAQVLGCRRTFLCVCADDAAQEVFLRALSAAAFKRAAEGGGKTGGIGGLVVGNQAAYAPPGIGGFQTAFPCAGFD